MRHRGHLYWTTLDKRRPVLVVSVDARNERANDVIVIPCSATLRPAPTHVLLARGDGGVRQACMLKCEQIATLLQDELDASPLGPPVSVRRMAEVERAVLRAIGVPIY